MKAIGQALGARSTTCCCRASRARCAAISRDKGDATDGVMLRALVPVNLRPIEKAYKLGNQFGLVFLDLPIGIENPVERLYAVRANMNALKGPTSRCSRSACWRRWAPGRRRCRTCCSRSSRATRPRVMTNVPGPQQPLYLAGARIDEPHVLGAAVGRHRHGRVDHLVRRRGAVRPHHRPKLCPDPERVIERFGARVREARADHADGAVAARAATSIPTRRGAGRWPRRADTIRQHERVRATDASQFCTTRSCVLNHFA